MKFLIIAFHPQSMTPYAKHYEKVIIKARYEYDIVFFDRFSNAPLEKKGNQFIFHRICTLGGNRLKKLYPFYLFRKTVKRIIKAGKYDKIIVLNTMPGFLLQDILIHSYPNKYIFDIRDYTYEKYTLYRDSVRKIISNSYFTAISSRGFMEFLGHSDKFVINHNITEYDGVEEPVLSLDKKQKLTIGFVGAVRYFDVNKALVDCLSKSSGYQLLYVGRQNEDCNLQEYCQYNNYKNVYFQGTYSNEDKPQIYQSIDIINSIYGNYSKEVTTLMPNRLYDALLFKRPILVSKGTYLADIVQKYRIGLAVNDITNVENEINRYIMDFDTDLFNTCANVLLSIVLKEQQEFYQKIGEFIRN